MRARSFKVGWKRGPDEKPSLALYEADEIAEMYVDETQGSRVNKADHVTHEEVADAANMHVASAREAGAKSGVQHHVMPQEHRAWFEARGIDIDDFTVRLPDAEHQALHGGGNPQIARAAKWPKEWNQRVMNRLKAADDRLMSTTGRPMSRQEIIDVVEAIMAETRIPPNYERYSRAPKKTLSNHADEGPVTP